MRDYTHIDEYLTRLYADVYPQPPDEGHTAWAKESIDAMLKHADGVSTVLDVGCGQGFCQELFNQHGKDYTGIAIGEDALLAVENHKNVFECDFSFIPKEDGSFDFLYSRHSLEHSPIPLITLMEWHRVTRRYVGIVLPAPEHWKYGGKNHYFVMTQEQWKILFDVAGFDIIYENVKRQRMAADNAIPEVEIEFWFLLEKRK
jgi:ubiquinone/menaquinone biosynthesis C-methylase UbiE